LDETAEVRICQRAESTIDLDVVADGTVIAAIKLYSRPGKMSDLSDEDALSEPLKISQPRDLPFEQLSDQRGVVATPASEQEIHSLFPALCNAVGAAAVGALMATSQIVGMACPGLHSLFA